MRIGLFSLWRCSCKRTVSAAYFIFQEVSTMENKKKMSKVLYVVIAVVLVLAAAFAVVALKTDLFNKKEVNDEVQVTYSLSVVALGETVYEGDVAAAEGTALMDSMLAALKEQEIEVVYEESEYGAYITAIGGYAQSYEDSLYWTFTVNGEMAMEGASYIIPAEGDKVVFTFEELTW